MRESGKGRLCRKTGGEGAEYSLVEFCQQTARRVAGAVGSLPYFFFFCVRQREPLITVCMCECVCV